MIKPLNATFLKWGAGFFCVVIIQVTALKYLAIEIRPNISVQPDVVLLLLFFFGMQFSQNTSITTGFAAGLLYDIFGGGIMGLSAFSKTVAGFLTGYIPRRHKMKNVSQFIVFLLVITIIHDLIFNAIYVINTDIDYWMVVALHTLPSSIYTLFIGVIIYIWLEQ
ncbi:rod shape-determining protein MreD [candidate division KSB1 bacterium]